MRRGRRRGWPPPLRRCRRPARERPTPAPPRTDRASGHGSARWQGPPPDCTVAARLQADCATQVREQGGRGTGAPALSTRLTGPPARAPIKQRVGGPTAGGDIGHRISRCLSVVHPQMRLSASAFAFDRTADASVSGVARLPRCARRLALASTAHRPIRGGSWISSMPAWQPLPDRPPGAVSGQRRQRAGERAHSKVREGEPPRAGHAGLVQERRTRATDVFVQTRDGPAPGSVLEDERKSGARRVDFKERPWARDHGVGRRLLADDRESGDREALVTPGDLAGRPLNQFVRTWTGTGSTRMNAMRDGSFPGAMGVSSGARVRQNVCSITARD